jgi:hypothetical protein
VKCHQRQIREAKAATPLPDETERRAVATFDHASIREISVDTARPVILDYEWLGTMGTTRYAVGLFFDDYLAGVACFGSTAGSNVPRSVCGIEHADKVMTLVRGTCVHWAPEHAASYLINKACELMAQRHGRNIFVAYSDVEAGEIGTVYQASGWLYVGKGGTPTLYINSKNETKDGRCLGAMIRSRRGRPDRKTATRAEMQAWVEKKRKEGYDVRDTKTPWFPIMTREQAEQNLFAQGFHKIRGTAKHRYIHFAGDTQTVRMLKKALKLKRLPYPTRDAV